MAFVKTLVAACFLVAVAEGYFGSYASSGAGSGFGFGPMYRPFSFSQPQRPVAPLYPQVPFAFGPGMFTGLNAVGGSSGISSSFGTINGQPIGGNFNEFSVTSSNDGSPSAVGSSSGFTSSFGTINGQPIAGNYQGFTMMSSNGGPAIISVTNNGETETLVSDPSKPGSFKRVSPVSEE